MSIRKEEGSTKTPAETVIGWLLVFLSFLVMSFGFDNGEINTIFWAGVVLIPVGIVFIVIGKQKQRTSKICPASK